jgi:hypothetical protein
MKDLVIAGAGGYSFSQVKNWINSLNKSGFSGDKILMSYGLKFEVVNELTERGIKVIDVKLDNYNKPLDLVTSTGKVTRENSHRLVHNLRFFHMWELLKKLQRSGVEYDRVITTDVRDVIFQYNPSDWLDDNQINDIIAPSESVMYRDESWNTDNFIKGFGPSIWEHLGRELLVCNVGTFAAKYDTFIDLCLMIYMIAAGHWVADQSGFNVLVNTTFKDKTQFVDADDAWAGQIGTLVENRAKIGEHMLNGEPSMNDGIVVNSNGEKFCLVHQYERVPGWEDIITRKYNEI